MTEKHKKQIKKKIKNLKQTKKSKQSNNKQLDKKDSSINTKLCGQLTNYGISYKNKVEHCGIYDRNYLICGAKTNKSIPYLQTKDKYSNYTTFTERIDYIKLNLYEEDKINLNFIKLLKFNYEDIKNKKIKFSEINDLNIKAVYISYCNFMSQYKNTNDELAIYFNVSSISIKYIKRIHNKELDQYLLYFYNTLKEDLNNEQLLKKIILQCYICNNSKNVTQYITNKNYIKFKKKHPNKELIIGIKICKNCDKNINKVKIQNILIENKQILNNYNTFNDYLSNLNDYFNRETKEE
ncbi:hypothetical protein ABK040_005740 [Willaertia magna]